MEGKMRADFLDRRTGFSGFTGGLGEWPGYEYGLRRHGGTASSPDLFFSHGRRGNRFQTQLQGIDHNRKGGAFKIEQPKVGPKGEPSGNVRIKGHREHGVDNEVL